MTHPSNGVTIMNTKNTNKTTSETKKNTKTQTETNGKKTRGQTKTWTVSDVKAKHKLTDIQWLEMAQAIPLQPNKHIINGKLNKVALMIIGKWLKANPFPEPVDTVDEHGKIIKELYACDSKPPNKLKLWMYDPSVQHGEKIICNVQEKVWQSHHKGMILLCEKIGEGLYTHPPIRT